jgi:glycosyltransferase involved in cell wall biosynthesis
MTQRRVQLDLVIVGPYPPPLGGVSSHVKRLTAVLEGRGLRVAVLNHFGHVDARPVSAALYRNPIFYWWQVRRLNAPVVHYHHARLDTLVAVALGRRRHGTAYIVTIHGHGLGRQLEIPLLRTLARWALGRFDEIVAVSPEIGRSVASTVVVPAYVPDHVAEGAAPEVARFLDRPGRTLVVSAYRVRPLGSGSDPYGLDLAVDAFLGVARSDPNVRLAIFLAHRAEGRAAERYLSRLLDRVSQAGLGGRMAVYVGANLAPAFAHDVIYLRPSHTDGDAVSVREALARGAPVLASDVVRRPRGAELVPAGDRASWVAATERALHRARNGASTEEAAEHLDALFDLYARHLPARRGKRPRMAVVSWNAAQPFSPRGERTRALAEALRAHWDVELIGGPPRGPGSRPRAGAAALLRRRARAVADLVLLDKHEPWSRARFRRWPADVDGALLIGYPFSPVSEAARALRAAGVPYVVDAGDPWVLTGPGPNRFVGRWRSLRAERRLWAGAAGAIVTTREQARVLSSLFPALPLLVRPNGYEPVGPATAPVDAPLRDGRLRLVHFGNLYAARLDVRGFLEQLRATGPWAEISLTLYGQDWTGILRRPPSGVTVRLEDPLPWPAAVRTAREFDLALAVGNVNPAQLPSKAVQYLALPIPRLALVESLAHSAALGEYVSDKPGWLVVGLDTPDPGTAVAQHLSRTWTAAALHPPASEAWPVVAGEIAGFVEKCLNPSAVGRHSKVVAI